MKSSAVSEPRWARVTLTCTALLFLGVLILLPVIVVFAEALRQGMSRP